MRDIFAELDARCDELSDVQVYVSFFEIYGARVQDLLNRRNRLNVREDGRGEVHVTGLQEFRVNNSEDLLDLVAQGNSIRTTQATETNDTSSRSHAICQVTLKRGNNRLLGKLSLVDLAGSERGQDTKSHSRQLRTESAEINKSLLALKECIRSIASGNTHVPFRASKLTMVCVTAPPPPTTTHTDTCSITGASRLFRPQAHSSGDDCDGGALLL